MKKQRASVLLLIMIALLTGCGSRSIETKEQDYFNGTVLAVYDRSVLVECTDSGSGAISVGSEASVRTDVTAADGTPKIAVGDIVRVVFSGVQESDPLGFDTVFAICFINENGDAVNLE